MDTQEKHKIEKLTPWKVCLLFCFASLFCTVASGEMVISGENEVIASKIFPQAGYYISATATAAASAGRIDTYDETKENLLSKKQFDRIKRASVALEVSVDNIAWGATGALLDVKGDKFYLLTNKHVINLYDPFITSLDNTYGGSEKPDIHSIEVWQPHISKQNVYNNNFRYQGVPNSDLVVIEIEDPNHPYKPEDVIPIDENYIFKTDELVGSAGFPWQVHSSKKSDYNTYYAEGKYRGISRNMPVFEMNLDHSSSGTLAYANVDGKLVGVALLSRSRGPNIFTSFENQGLGQSLKGVGDALDILQSGKH